MSDALHPLMAAIIEDGIAQLAMRQRLDAILGAYERAKADPETKLPTYFMAVLEAAKQ